MSDVQARAPETFLRGLFVGALVCILAEASPSWQFHKQEIQATRASLLLAWNVLRVNSERLASRTQRATPEVGAGDSLLH